MTRCRGCAATWAGAGTHCPTCHGTWPDVSGFDRLRADGSCARAAARPGWQPLVFEDAR